MRLLRVLIAVALFIIGGLLLTPLAQAWFQHQRATGQVLELFTAPAGDGLVQTGVAYQFTVDTSQGVRRYLAYAQADGLFHRVEDPLLDADELEGARRSLGLTAGGSGARGVTVLYRAEDPGGTAFIQSISPNDRTRRYAVGLGVVVAALVVLWFAGGSGTLDTGSWTRSMRRLP